MGSMDRNYRVRVYDGSMGYASMYTLIDNTSRAAAKSIARHFNRVLQRIERENQCTLDICYYSECRDDYGPGRAYWE